MGQVVNYKAAVEKRLEDVKKEDIDKKDGGSGDGMDSNFIMECLTRNELGDGELYQKLYRDQFVFNKAKDAWMYWTGHHWAEDWMNFAVASVEGAAAVYVSEAKRLSKKIQEFSAKDKPTRELEDMRKNLNQRVSALRSTRRRNNCLTFAHTSKDALAISGSELDQKPWLLPCKNGVINLKTGELEPGRPKDYLMVASPVEWQGLDAKCDLWDKKLMEIFSGDQEIVDCLRRTAGMSLVAKVLQSVLVVLTGRGRNGKSLIVEVLSKVLGPLAGAIRSEMLLDQFRISNSAGPTPDIMALKGLRVAFASETDENCKISSSKVKWLTGNDTLSGRNPHDKYEVQFKPSHTLFLLTNHLPHASAEDFALWERMIVFPFKLSFVNREPRNDKELRADPELPEKLENELPGILAWMVRGCIEWQEFKNIKPPAAMKEAKTNYQRNEDIIADFVDDCCVTGDGYEVSAKMIYDAFEEWWRKNNISKKAPSTKWFGDRMTKKFEKEKKGTVKYFGVGLLAEDSDRLLEDPEDLK